MDDTKEITDNVNESPVSDNETNLEAANTEEIIPVTDPDSAEKKLASKDANPEPSDAEPVSDGTESVPEESETVPGDSEEGFYNVAVSDEEADEDIEQSKAGTKISAVIVAAFALLGVIALVIILVTVIKTQDDEEKAADNDTSNTSVVTDPAAYADVSDNAGDTTTAETSDASDSSDVKLPIDYVDYGVKVTLADYKNLKLNVAEVSVTDEDVEKEIADFLDSLTEMREVTDRAAQSGDTVTIDYDGVCEGEHRDSMTASDFDLIIGSHRFIDGFEDGVIGMKTGETKVLSLVFPETYSEDLAGKPVDFTVTLKTIKAEYTPELTDEVIAEKTDQKTVAEYREYVRASLLSTKQKTAKNEAFEEVLDAYIKSCSFSDEIEEEIKDRMEYYRKYFDSYYTQAFGVDTQTYVGATDEDFNVMLREYSEPDIKLPYVLRGIAEAEGYVPTEEEKATRFNEIFYDIYGFESEEKIYENFTKKMTEVTVEQDLLANYGYDKIRSILGMDDED